MRKGINHKKYTLSLTPETLEKLNKLKELNYVSISMIVRLAVDEFFEKNGRNT